MCTFKPQNVNYLVHFFLSSISRSCLAPVPAKKALLWAAPAPAKKALLWAALKLWIIYPIKLL